MLDPLEIPGIWWLPENPEHRIPGTLRFSQEDGGRLELQGIFEGLEVLKSLHHSHEVILGFSIKGKAVTLSRCYRKGYELPMPGIGTSTYRVLLLFDGVHFQSEADITFKNINVNYTDLDEWVGVSGFEIDIENSNVNMRYRRPESIHVDIDENLGLSINFIHTGLRQSYVTKEIKLTQRTYFKLDNKEGELDFFEFQQRLRLLRNMLILSVSRLVYPVHMTGTTEKAKQERDDKPPFYPLIDIYYQLVEPPVIRKLLIRDEMLFSFEKIQPRFEDFIQNWFANAEDLKAVYDLYFGSLYSQRLFINHRFLNITQGLETYHRLRINNQVLPENDHNQRVEEIIDAVGEKYHRWLRGLFSFGNQPSLKMRLWDITENYGVLIPPEMGDREGFVAMIVATRHHMTHHTKNKKAITDPIELYEATRILTILLESFLLEELGFSRDEVLEIQQNRQRYPM